MRHTFEVRADLQSLENLMVEAEAGVRGYLLTRDRDSLAPYRDSSRELPRLIRHLESLIGDNPAQAARARRVREQVKSRMTALAALLRVFRESGGTADLQSALVRSSRSMEEARAELSAMYAEEERLLAIRSGEAERGRRQTYLWIGAASLLGLIAGLLAPALLGAAVVSRIAVLRRNAGRLAERDPLEPQRLGGDEIGQLGEALVKADQLLSEREGKLRETEHFLQHLIETSPTVIFRQDLTTMQVTYVSPNSERILGYSPQEIMAASGFWMEHTHPDDQERVRKEDREQFGRRAQEVETEYRFRRRNGEYIWLRSFAQLEYAPDGKPLSLLGHRLDISAAKRAEQALIERQTTLDATNRELEAFSYSVSHDLRAPLRAVDGFSRILFEEYSSQLPPEAADYLKRVRAATERMSSLISDLLNLSRVTRAQMSREKIDLSRMAQTISDDLRQGDPGRQVEFIIEAGVTAVGDQGLLRVLLQNLLGNSWKFTSGHPTARIEFGRMPHSDGRPVYFVRDDGAGFDAAYSAKLFGAFQRLHSVDQFPGTGIGLATVQRVVHRHGGTVWGSGAVEQGATFYFTLQPGADGEAPAMRERSPEVQAPASARGPMLPDQTGAT